MAGNTEGKIDFNFGELDWDHYESYRPPYPQALYQLIYDHHQANGGQWNTALDIGAGGGVVTKQLLNRFSHVVFSDAGPGYVAQAQRRFAKEAEAGRVSFLQRKFHEFKPSDDFPRGEPVDLLTAGTCIHFCGSAETIMSQFAPLLRSGGTAAVFTYNLRARLPAGDPAAGPLDACLDKLLLITEDKLKHLGDEAPSVFYQSRYGVINFDTETWRNVRRITSLPEVQYCPSGSSGTSRIKPDIESEEQVADDFISGSADYAFFEKYFPNFYAGWPILDWIKGELEELKAALGDRRVNVTWPLYLVMATKR